LHKPGKNGQNGNEQASQQNFLFLHYTISGVSRGSLPLSFLLDFVANGLVLFLNAEAFVPSRQRRCTIPEQQPRLLLPTSP
jgi:hypothetical protein